MASTYNYRGGTDLANGSAKIKQSTDLASMGTDKGIGKLVGKDQMTVGGGESAVKGTASSQASGYTKDLNSYLDDPTIKFNPSDSVTSAQNYLDGLVANKPGSYVSQYTGQLENLYGQIMNRQKFNYDMNGDAMYQLYANRYKQQGLQNMRDVMGQASAQTGGYGSSYAQTAGQSAYNSAMGELAERVPELQAQAQQRYNDETQDITNRYNVVSSADQREYQRYQDAYNNYINERNFAASEADRLYNREYQQHADAVSTAQQMYAMQREDERFAMENAQKFANEMISKGKMPDDELLIKTGWSKDSVRQLVKANRK